MSLVKFTELPSGSLQGGDVLAVAGASSYKVTSTELANFINKRVQGATTSTVAFVETKAIANKATIDGTIIPQLGQIGTNKAGVAANHAAQHNTDLYAIENRKKIYAMANGQYDNQPSIIASLIKNDNFIKNPAAQHIKLYWEPNTGRPVLPDFDAALRAKNLQYPGWSRDGGDLLTYNFTVALDGMLTLGQLGGNNAADLEYRVNGGAWDKVGAGGIKSIGVGYVGSTAGAQISVRMNLNSGGIAFAIPSPAYWTNNVGVRDPNIRTALEKLTYGLRRGRIDLEGCGYWFHPTGKVSNGEYGIGKSSRIGTIKDAIAWGFDNNSGPTVVLDITWIDPSHKLMFKVTSKFRDVSYIFASTDPNLYNKAEIY